MNISYNNTIVNKQFIPIEKTKYKPTISVNENTNTNINGDVNTSPVFILIMHDPDANGQYIHWLVANGKTFLSYKPPDPPNNEIHHYIFSLYLYEKDDGNVTKYITKYINNRKLSRERFDGFTKDFKLIDEQYFITNH